MTPAETVDAFLRDNEIPHGTPAPGVWTLALSGTSKHQIPVTLSMTSTGLRAESFFMRAPQENHEEFYRLLLSHGARSRSVRFALDAEGDVFIVSHVPTEAVSSEELDRLIGEILSAADSMFSPAISLGFAAYLAADMAWRAKQPK